MNVWEGDARLVADGLSSLNVYRVSLDDVEEQPATEQMHVDSEEFQLVRTNAVCARTPGANSNAHSNTKVVADTYR
jgi:hypothetical protein